MWKKLKTAPVSLLLLVLWSLDSTAQAKSTKKDATNKGDPFVCDPDKLLVYRVTLSTHWSRTNFPKQYPEWRPPAQWSKMIGNSQLIHSFISIDFWLIGGRALGFRLAPIRVVMVPLNRITWDPNKRINSLAVLCGEMKFHWVQFGDPNTRLIRLTSDPIKRRLL